ncbi:MAG: glycoside hydrolase family 16 protein [Acholeplasmataceae bacterium]|nr:glycoside hydrolase family 16 protein [Acholeplasmataceae bacterium]
MKKIVFVMILVGSIFFASCTKGEETDEFNPDDNLDLDNIFFDNFENGIDINNWEIANTKWGTTNNGVIAQNVHYTDDGVVVLQANGDYYAGPHKGYNSNSGTRTGAALISNEAFGPGRFEVRMKALPRFGATSAFWTFYYNHELSLNQEIDIELNVNNSFRSIWTTNWVTLTDTDHRQHVTDIVHNDGEWHTYKFEWHTNPARIDYYVDDILLHTSDYNIPNYAGRLWIGHWFPDGWAGTPDFETDYMFVDWIRYTPYLDNPYIETAGGRSNFPSHYPTAPIEMPLNNLISNPGFEGSPDAWRKTATSLVEIVSNQGINNSKALFVPKDDIVYQFVTGMDETFEVTLWVKVKLEHLDDAGMVLIEARPLETTRIESYSLTFDKNDPNFVLGEYYMKEMTIDLPVGTRRLEVSLIGTAGNGIYFDDLYLNLSHRMPNN